MNTNNDWHTISAEETAKRLNVNPYMGLSEKEARRRRAKYGRNRIWHVPRTDPRKAILSTAGDLSTVLLFITAVLALFFEERREAVTVCVILAVGTLLRIITYLKAKKIIEVNAAENIPTAAVLRDGTVRLVSSADLVPGDIVLLHPGDTVPSDGRVISESDSIVSEAGITENKEQVHKYSTTIHSKPGSAAIPCESRPNILYAGSTVLSGNPRMIVCATGEEALVSMKQGGIFLPAGDNLPLIERLNGRCKASELLMLAFVALISALSLFINTNLRLEQVFFAAVSTAAASMSGYLTSIGFIIIAVSAQSSSGMRGKKQNVSQKRAVITDCAAMERIAAADCVILGDISLLKSGKAVLHRFFANGRIHRDASSDPASLQRLLSLARNAVGSGGEGSSLANDGKDTPLREREQLIHRAGLLFAESCGKSPFLQDRVIDRANSPMTVGLDLAIFLSGENHTPYAAAAGDVQTILRCCTSYRTEKGITPLTDEQRKVIFTETARLEFIGAKILAAASRPAPYLTLTKASSLLTEMCFEGFFSLAEMPADGVRETISELKNAGTRVILLSSHPEQDLYYGHDLGLFGKGTKIVPHTCQKEILQTEKSLIVAVPPYDHTGTGQELSAAAARYRVVKNAGENTAFFTKEALDSRGLSASGCGIAVSRSNKKAAAQALKNHAVVVVYPNGEEEHGGLTEGVSAMKEARRALINTENASLYLTVSQIMRLCVLLLGVLLGLTIPSPAAVLAGGILLDFGAVLAMAFEKAPENALGIPCGTLPGTAEQMKKTIPYGILSAVLSLSLPLLANGIAPLLHVHPLTVKEAVSLITASLFLSCLVLSVRFMKRGRLLRKGITFHSAILCCSAAVLAADALILFEKHTASLIGGAPVPWHWALLALLPSLILFVITEISARIGQSREKRT